MEDLENDDSSSDGEWKGNNLKKIKGQKQSGDASTKINKLTFHLTETEAKTRILPRRAVTLNKKNIIERDEVDSELDSENNE